MRHNNPAITSNALAAALAVIDGEIENVRESIGCCNLEIADHWMEEFAELRTCKRVLERLYHEAHMDALEEAEYEEMRRDAEREEREVLTYEEREEIRSYHADLEELDELLAGLKGLEF